MASSDSNNQADSGFLFAGQKKEFLDWLEALKISKYWLDTLSIEDAFSLCEEVYQVLQNVQQLELTTRERLSVLIEIQDCLKGLCEKLQSIYLGASFPLDDHERKAVDIIVNSYLALAKDYQEMIDDDGISNLPKNLLALNIIKGVQALSTVFLVCAEIYTEPDVSFWVIYYHLLSHAKVFNVFNMRVKIEDKLCVASLLFKHVLIFYILDRYRFTPKEIKKLFNLLFMVSRHVELKTEPSSSNTMIGFYLERDELPAKLDANTLVAIQTLHYINIADVAKVIQILIHKAEKITPKNLEEINLYGLVLKGLEQKDRLYHIQVQKKYPCHTLLGVHQIIEFLLEKERKAATPRHRQKHEKYKSLESQEDELDSLELMLDWDEKEVPKIKPNEVITQGMQIIDSSMDNYTLLWEKKMGIDLHIGELIGLIPDFKASKNRVEVGLVRRIKVTPKGVIFKVDVIGLESTLIYMEKTNSFEAGEWVLFLFGSPKYEIGIVSTKDYGYQADEAVSVQLSDKMAECKLGKLLNSTAIVNHIALHY